MNKFSIFKNPEFPAIGKNKKLFFEHNCCKTFNTVVFAFALYKGSIFIKESEIFINLLFSPLLCRGYEYINPEL